ncbi:hypothetical protein S83_011931, partial [Arachis hypogaea]
IFITGLECFSSLIRFLLYFGSLLEKSRIFDEALFLLRNLITEEGIPPLVLLEVLIKSYRRCCSSIAIVVTESAYDIIYKLRSLGCFITIHIWNNFPNHLLQINEIDRFWNSYRGMGSFGYMENVNTFNL